MDRNQNRGTQNATYTQAASLLLRHIGFSCCRCGSPISLILAAAGCLMVLQLASVLQPLEDILLGTNITLVSLDLPWIADGGLREGMVTGRRGGEFHLPLRNRVRRERRVLGGWRQSTSCLWNSIPKVVRRWDIPKVVRRWDIPKVVWWWDVPKVVLWWHIPKVVLWWHIPKVVLRWGIPKVVLWWNIPKAALWWNIPKVVPKVAR